MYVSAGAPDEPAPSTAAVFNQKGCRYIPHLLAFQVNQELKIVNDDQTSHNIHPLPKLNREWNKSQPPGTPPISEKYDKAEIYPGEVQCSSLDARHFRGTKELPLCGDRRWWCFHVWPTCPRVSTPSRLAKNRYGDQSQDVTVSGSETKTVNFVFKAKALLRHARRGLIRNWLENDGKVYAVISARAGGGQRRGAMGKLLAVTIIVIAILSAIPVVMHTWEAPADISTSWAHDRQPDVGHHDRGGRVVPGRADHFRHFHLEVLQASQPTAKA